MLKTVSAKLSASAGLGLLVVLAVTGVGLLTQQHLLGRADSISAAAESVRQVTAVRAALARARRHDQEAVAASASPDLMELRAADWTQAMGELRAGLKALQAGLADDPSAGAKIQRMDAGIAGYAGGFGETLAGVKKGLLADPVIADGTMQEARASAETADRQVAELAAALVARADQARAEMQQAAWQSRRVLLGLVALFAAIGITGALLMRRTIMRPLAEAVAIARRVASGDLAGTPPRPRADEFGQLLAALDDMRARLQALVSDVRGSVESVATAASQIAGGNTDLSVRTERQAASLQSAAHAVQRISDSIAGGADGARAASASAQAMFAAAQRDGERVGRVVETMQQILDASQRIQQVTALIDDLGTQTHILGLNASVEAANAGDRGRGFGVVAANVRSLAERCRAAAAEVRGLVGDAGRCAGDGMALARQAGSGIAALIDSAREVSGHIGSISALAQQQREAIGEVGASMSEIDGATQQNAALVEEAAAAAQSLKAQAERLAESVAAFRLH
jgi:methyl-accepting chemotaxis protein